LNANHVTFQPEKQFLSKASIPTARRVGKARQTRLARRSPDARQTLARHSPDTRQTLARPFGIFDSFGQKFRPHYFETGMVHFNFNFNFFSNGCHDSHDRQYDQNYS
jgi:hypothetical protein